MFPVLVLLALHAAFYALPIVRMLRARRGAGAPVAAEGRWAMGLHGVALVGMYVALGAAILAGDVAGAPPVRAWVGGAVAFAGDALMIAAMRAFRSWRLAPTLTADHELCTVGPYGVVRHPIYLAFDLLLVGTAIWGGTPALWLAAAAGVVTGDLRARVEERALVRVFGDRYVAYAGRVARFVPGVY